jgi:hypothetical protein
MADPNGIIARVTTALRYAATGNAPTSWFGPGTPLAPQAPESVRGRGWDFPQTFNLNYKPRSGEFVGFAKLVNLADNCGPLRMIIERQKDLIEGLEWTIKARTDLPGMATSDDGIVAITQFLEQPDRLHDWPQWIRAVLEQNMVIDAVSLYARPTRGGDLYALELIDGATIKPILDDGGRVPVAPDASYQQILKGLPAVNYTTDELTYYPQNFRPNRVYGYSKVEQIKDVIETNIARMTSQLAYFTHGNIGDGYFTGSENATPDQVRSIEMHWNSLMTTNAQGKRQGLFLPHGYEWHSTKTEVLSDMFDEWLIRLTCFGFGVSPTPFIKQTGMSHGTTQGDKDTAKEGGSAPLMQFIRRLMNRLLADRFLRPDLEFSWNQDVIINAKEAADIDDIRLKNGSTNINQVRDRNGESPIEGGDVNRIYFTNDAVAVDGIEQAAADAAEAVKLAASQPKMLPSALDPNAEVKPKPKPVEKLAKAAAASAVKQLHRLLTAYFADKADEYSTIISDALYDGDMVKAADYSPRIEDALDEVDWIWSDLPGLIMPGIAGVAVAAGTEAVSELGLFDAKTLKLVTARATAWADSRAAELVGMKWIDGALVENPDAAFSIAETTRTTLRDLISKAMDKGSSNSALAKDIQEATAFSSDRAQLIATTETATADIQGNIAGWRASGVVGGRQFNAAPDCCDECQAQDGVIVGIDEEFPEGDAPLHPNCFPGDTLVLPVGAVTSVSERPFEGDIIVIGTASGKRLTCTPNHPVLTPSGWVAAGILNVSDDVISSLVGDFVTGRAVADNAENVPARIEDIAKAFGRSPQVTATEVPVSAPHFHGDGEGSEVAIILSDRLLRSGGNASDCKHCGKPLLRIRDVSLQPHPGASAEHTGLQLPGTPERIRVSGRDLSLPLVTGHLRPLERFSLAPVAWLYPAAEQALSNGSSINSDVLGESIFRHSAKVHLRDSLIVDNVPSSQGGSSQIESGSGELNAYVQLGANVSDFDAALVKPDHLSTKPDLHRRAPNMAMLARNTSNSAQGKPELAGDLCQGFSGQIFLDNVVSISRRKFSGHVFNLGTESGFIIAGGVVTHNCRCDETAVLPEDMPDAGDTTEESNTE